MVHTPNGPSQKESLPATDLEFELKRDLHAPAIARAAAIEHYGDCDLSPSQRHTLVLLLSEVVTNAVLHSSAPIDAPIFVTAGMTTDAVRVAVTDAGDGFTPQPRPPEVTHGGYGLYLVDKAANRWGVDQVSGTRVWFELPRTT